MDYRSVSRVRENAVERRTAEQFIEQIVIAKAAALDSPSEAPKAAAYAKMADLWRVHANHSSFRVGFDMAKGNAEQVAHFIKRMYEAVLRLVVLNTTTFVRS